MATIIAADEIKKTLPGYTLERSEDFHRESARLADKEFERALRVRHEETVVIMAGGAASGKTEYVSAYLNDQDLIVFDGTLPTFIGAEIKIRKIIQAGKKVEIHLILPGLLNDAFFAFLHRERKFSPSHFYRTHSGCRRAVLEVARKYDDLEIKIFISKINTEAKTILNYGEVKFANREQQIEYLTAISYTEDEIRDMLAHNE